MRSRKDDCADASELDVNVVIVIASCLLLDLQESAEPGGKVSYARKQEFLRPARLAVNEVEE